MAGDFDYHTAVELDTLFVALCNAIGHRDGVTAPEIGEFLLFFGKRGFRYFK